ncbi:unnamed protein product [Albugo candida]|uniref:Uncharacterized protein n=1 Tax=Albugo candida TaxID=65357 RepID=A0A024FW38_9STRA|nr:unnamed protein product [Albugo candida]|eukprot:CCI11373.1 unnamed protein product [Albugo candida]
MFRIKDNDLCKLEGNSHSLYNLKCLRLLPFSCRYRIDIHRIMHEKVSTHSKHYDVESWHYLAMQILASCEYSREKDKKTTYLAMWSK